MKYAYSKVGWCIRGITPTTRGDFYYVDVRRRMYLPTYLPKYLRIRRSLHR